MVSPTITHLLQAFPMADRYHHFGEGRYDESERMIRPLLAEGGNMAVGDALVMPRGAVYAEQRAYTAPSQLERNHWTRAFGPAERQTAGDLPRRLVLLVRCHNGITIQNAPQGCGSAGRGSPPRPTRGR
jgi:hypothetical protein